MQLYFIRHGQSQNNAHWGDASYIESPDPALTEIGVAQAHLLAEYLGQMQVIQEHERWDVHNRHGFGFTQIYTSLMERAVLTAAPTALKLSLPFSAWPEIHESGGIYKRDGEQKLRGLPGLPRAYFEEHIPGLSLPISLDGNGWWNNRPFETEEECQLRAQQVWAELHVRHGDQEGQPEQHVIFFSHGGFFMHLMCAMLNLPWRQAALGMRSWFLLSNCSISRFNISKGEVMICYLNRTDHLPDALNTG